MVRSTDRFWNDVEDMNNGGMKCKFCGHLFSQNTSISRIKWHLSGVKRRGVKICENVPEEVQDAARAAIDGPPEKRNKNEAGSSNNEVTNAISAPAKEQNNEVIHLDMAQQEAAFPLESSHVGWIASLIKRSSLCWDVVLLKSFCMMHWRLYREQKWCSIWREVGLMRGHQLIKPVSLKEIYPNQQIYCVLAMKDVMINSVLHQ